MSQEPPAGRVRVLVVDDDETFANAIMVSPTEDGRMDVIGIAADGQQALELSDRWRPDVVLLDLNIPHVDGYEVMQRLTSRAHQPAVVFVTGAEVEDLELAAQLGPDAWLRKTTDADAVVISAVLAAAVGKRSLTA